jgi:hypothetical protein
MADIRHGSEEVSCRRYIPDFLGELGDISYQHGEVFPPHQSHRHGRNIDVRPLRKDSQPIGVSITDPQYSRERTKILVEILLSHYNVQRILFNDTAIAGVHFFQGHHNHLHVEMKR